MATIMSVERVTRVPKNRSQLRDLRGGCDLTLLQEHVLGLKLRQLIEEEGGYSQEVYEQALELARSIREAGHLDLGVGCALTKSEQSSDGVPRE
jgi:hypothetical protein